MKRLLAAVLAMAGAGPYTCNCGFMADTAVEFNAHTSGCPDR